MIDVRGLVPDGVVGNKSDPPKIKKAEQITFLAENESNPAQDRLAAQNDLSLAELSSLLESEFGLKVSLPTVCRALQKMNLRRKKRAFSPASE